MHTHNFAFIIMAALFSLVALSSAPSYGQTQSQTQAQYSTPNSSSAYPSQYPVLNQKVKITKKVVAPKPPEPFINLIMTLSHSRSLYDHKDGSMSETNDMEFAPILKWSSNYSTQVYIAYSQDIKNSAASDSTDLMLINSRKAWNLGSSFTFSPGIIAVVPASKDSRENRSMYGGLGAKLTLGLQDHMLWKGVYLRTALTGVRNAYRYEIANDGTSNNAYASRQILQTGYAYGIFSLDFEFDHVNAWTYAGTLKEKFEHITEATANLTDNWGFTLGLTNSGSVFKPNGTETNLKYIDENNSMVYAKVTMQF